jgi:hypothetical protein
MMGAAQTAPIIMNDEPMFFTALQSRALIKASILVFETGLLIVSLSAKLIMVYDATGS